jgi:hypothetical protein
LGKYLQTFGMLDNILDTVEKRHFPRVPSRTPTLAVQYTMVAAAILITELVVAIKQTM